MKCRKLVINNDKQNIVWFNSYGKKSFQDGSITFKVDELESIKSFNLDKDFLQINNVKTITVKISTNNITSCSVHYDVRLEKSNENIIYSGNFQYNNSYSEFDISFPTNIKSTPFLSGSVNFYLELIEPSSGNRRLTLTLKHNATSSLKADNYSENGLAVRDSLIQRLSLIQGELWYRRSYGIPLLQKIKNKGIYDSVIVNIIKNHPNVQGIIEFNSRIDEHSYRLNFVAESKNGERVPVDMQI